MSEIKSCISLFFLWGFLVKLSDRVDIYCTNAVKEGRGNTVGTALLLLFGSGATPEMNVTAKSWAGLHRGGFPVPTPAWKGVPGGVAGPVALWLRMWSCAGLRGWWPALEISGAESIHSIYEVRDANSINSSSDERSCPPAAGPAFSTSEVCPSRHLSALGQL